MVNYQLILKPSAERDLKRLHGSKLEALQKAMETLAVNPRGPRTKKLEPAHLSIYRSDAVKSHRIIFEIEDTKKVIRIRRVRDRKDVYKK